MRKFMTKPARVAATLLLAGGSIVIPVAEASASPYNCYTYVSYDRIGYIANAYCNSGYGWVAVTVTCDYNFYAEGKGSYMPGGGPSVVRCPSASQPISVGYSTW